MVLLIIHKLLHIRIKVRIRNIRSMYFLFFDLRCIEMIPEPYFPLETTTFPYFIQSIVFISSPMDPSFPRVRVQQELYLIYFNNLFWGDYLSQ